MSEPANASDLELLARYTRHHAEDAFATLVRRHVDLVHSAALRQVRSAQLAEEVAQTTFTKLARVAPQLAPDTILTAWLYQVTRREAIDVVRREARRQLREQIATELNTMNATTADWTHIEPILDEAMAELDDTDRAAVLLRYFENKSLREVGTTLGTSDDAAQKRVSRAVERLREFFAKRGITVGASGLAVVISANAVQAAPVGLAITISTAAALTGTTLATATTATAIKTIAMTTLQKTVITATLAVVAGAGIYEARQNSQLRDENQIIRQQQAPLTEQLQQLQRSFDDATNHMAVLRDQNERLNRNNGELLRLRGEVGLLRNQSKDVERLEKLNREQIQQTPSPEVLDSREEEMIAKMNSAKTLVLGLIMHGSDNNDVWPTDLSMTSNYLGSAHSDIITKNQFELVVRGSFKSITNPSMTIAVRERVASFIGNKRGKTYGFADGHSEFKQEPPEGFDAWEKQHMIPPAEEK